MVWSQSAIWYCISHTMWLIVISLKLLCTVAVTICLPNSIYTCTCTSDVIIIISSKLLEQLPSIITITPRNLSLVDRTLYHCYQAITTL